MNLYDFAVALVDKRLPQFTGAGSKRSGAQVHFGKGRGMFFLSQCLVLRKRNGKYIATTEAEAYTERGLK